MKTKIGSILLLLLCATTSLHSQQNNFTDHFTEQRLRINIVLAGNSQEQHCYLESLNKEPFWGGSQSSLVQDMNYGEYKYRVETQSGKIIFSKGFNTLFQEWRTTAEANEISKSFRSSYTIPFPNNKVNVIFSERNRNDGKFYDIATFPIDPLNKSISSENTNDFNICKIHDQGDPKNKVDLVLIAEGYTLDQMDKFRKDAKRFVGYLFDIEPYKSREKDFNIWVVESVSKDSGTDIPHNDKWANTALSSMFYTFGIDRYLTAPDQTIIAQAASKVPYDALYVIVNTEKYGGGGIYNFYGLSMADHPTSAQVFVHELGHSFAGLADEYYTSDVAYQEFYNLALEPWEPNITTKVNFESKWADMLEGGKAGLFEGGGYMAKGIFRPAEDCRMKANTAPAFCPVCTRAINKMIDNYIK